MTTTVAHWLDRPTDPSAWVYIGRDMLDGYFGNPYSAKLYGREVAIHYYRSYFKRMMAKDEEFAHRVWQLRGKVLVCHCKPMDCHGDVIAEYLNSLPD
jgi:hypothetical protein